MNSLPAPPDRRLRVLLCGYGHLGLALLQGLLGCPDICEVVGVFRWLSRPGGQDFWEPVESIFQQLTKTSDLRDIACPGMNAYEFSAELEKLKPDVVLVGSWGEILKEHLLNRPDILFVNCHPSKLPAHRGANPYASVIMQEESETGVTFHRMAKGVDTGPILLQETLPLNGHETGDILRQTCAALAFQMLPNLLEKLYSHIIQGEVLDEAEQDITQKSYFPPIKPEHGLIDWTMNAPQLYRQCRALYPWIANYSYIEGKRKVLLFSPRFIPSPDRWKGQQHEGGTILELQKGVLTIALADPEWVLELPMYYIMGKKTPWPFWLTKLLSPFIFRPGKRFSTPFP